MATTTIKQPKQMNSYSDKNLYVKRLEEAADLSSKPPSDIEKEKQIDQVFEPEQEEQSGGGTTFLEKFWDSLTE